MTVSVDNAAIIKGMLARGDKQQWIAAWFGGDYNSGRIADINTGKTHKGVKPAPASMLPPVGPYASGQAAHRALTALRIVQAEIERAMCDLSPPSAGEGE